MTELVLEALARSGPLLVVAVVIAVGIASGALARSIHLPGMTGQILAGVAMGGAGLALFSEDALEGLVPLTELALGLIAITVGAHLNLARLRNAGRRLALLLLAESLVTPAVVYGVMHFIGGATPGMAALFAAISIATAPATVVALVRESRAKGIFVKTLVAGVALNNMACILAFELARAAYKTSDAVGGPLRAGFGDSLVQLGVSALVGASLAIAMALTSRVATRSDRLATAAVVALVAGVGISNVLDVSPLLTCLVMGFVQTNITKARSQLVDSIFADFEPAILAVFFTLAGMHLSFEHAVLAGLASLLLFLARAGGKTLAARIAMKLAGATEALQKNLGMALVPQAGVGVGLVLLV
jgi:NhaP-type Na+/H+ or K+/H+ antiporter